MIPAALEVNLRLVGMFAVLFWFGMAVKVTVSQADSLAMASATSVSMMAALSWLRSWVAWWASWADNAPSPMVHALLFSLSLSLFHMVDTMIKFVIPSKENDEQLSLI